MSDWRERANRRRDERHTAIPDDAPRPKPGSKNTKKWCKGKVGREHKPECRDGHIQGWKNLVCTECGKHLDYYWPIRWRPLMGDQPRPAWVVD
jgi:hypothetical protein